MKHALLVLLAVAACACRLTAAAGAARNPLVFIPGFMGSYLEARYSFKPGEMLTHGCQCKTTAACSSGGKFKLLWLSEEEGFKPYAPFCWLNKMKLSLEKGRYKNSPGVEVRPMDFGGFLGIEGKRSASDAPNLLDRISSALGYKRGVDMFGAPYDWRNGEAGLEQSGTYAALRALIQRAYNKNKKQPVIILSHSMGNHVALSFLHKQTPAWRARYVRRWVMAAPDFGGDLDTLAAMLGGAGPLDRYTSRELALTSATAGLGWLSAYPYAFGRQPILYTDTRNYTAADMPQLLRDIGRPDAAAVFAANHNLHKYVKPLPGLETYSVFGNDSTTWTGFYTPKLSRKEAVPLTAIKGPGDGDVALPSLMVSLRVAANRSRVFALPGVDHLAIVGEGEGEGPKLGVKAVLALLAGNTAPLAKYSLATAAAAAAAAE